MPAARSPVTRHGRRAADAIETSKLGYTIMRPAWLTDEGEVDDELTERDAPFKGTIVSRKSVADPIVKIIRSPSLHLHGNRGQSAVLAHHFR